MRRRTAPIAAFAIATVLSGCSGSADPAEIARGEVEAEEAWLGRVVDPTGGFDGRIGTQSNVRGSTSTVQCEQHGDLTAAEVTHPESGWSARTVAPEPGGGLAGVAVISPDGEVTEIAADGEDAVVWDGAGVATAQNRMGEDDAESDEHTAIQFAVWEIDCSQRP